MGAAVGAGQRVDLVDHDHAQISEKRAASTRCETSMTSSDSGVVISSSVGLLQELRPVVARRVAVPDEPAQPTISV